MKEFKDLQITWSYITTCESVICSSCKTSMHLYVEKQKDNDNVDFGDLAECTCGNDRFNGVHSGKGLSLK